jgi:hypothetical protein
MPWDRVGHGGLPRGQGECGDTAFERGQALFQHILGRVHDARIDVALNLQVEQVGSVLGIVESEGHGLVDRHGHSARGRVGIIAAVDGDGFEFPLRIVWHVVSLLLVDGMREHCRIRDASASGQGAPRNDFS